MLRQALSRSLQIGRKGERLSDAHGCQPPFPPRELGVVRGVATERHGRRQGVDNDQAGDSRDRGRVQVGVFERFDDQADVAFLQNSIRRAVSSASAARTSDCLSSRRRAQFNVFMV